MKKDYLFGFSYKDLSQFLIKIDHWKVAIQRPRKTEIEENSTCVFLQYNTLEDEPNSCGGHGQWLQLPLWILSLPGP